MPSTSTFYTLSLHDALPIYQVIVEIETAKAVVELPCPWAGTVRELLVEPGQTVEGGAPIIAIDRLPRLDEQLADRSEEHTSELQSRRDHVCRPVLEKKKLCV